jgi:hypothetical protein
MQIVALYIPGAELSSPIALPVHLQTPLRVLNAYLLNLPVRVRQNRKTVESMRMNAIPAIHRKNIGADFRLYFQENLHSLRLLSWCLTVPGRIFSFDLSFLKTILGSVKKNPDLFLAVNKFTLFRKM